MQQEVDTIVTVRGSQPCPSVCPPNWLGDLLDSHRGNVKHSLYLHSLYFFSLSGSPSSIDVYVSSSTWWNERKTARYGRRVFGIHNTCPNQRSLQSLIRCDRIFLEPISNSRFLILTLLSWSFRPISDTAQASVNKNVQSACKIHVSQPYSKIECIIFLFHRLIFLLRQVTLRTDCRYQWSKTHGFLTSSMRSGHVSQRQADIRHMAAWQIPIRILISSRTERCRNAPLMLPIQTLILFKVWPFGRVGECLHAINYPAVGLYWPRKLSNASQKDLGL